MSSDFDFDTPVVTRRRGTKAAVEASAPASFPEPAEAADVAEGQEADIADTQDKPKYDPEELASVFDEILFSGEYTEEVSIRGKLKVVFRTRTADEMKEISRIVDGTQAVFANTLEGVRSLLQLQYALSFYQGKDLRSVKGEEKAKFIGRLPSPVIAALLAALARFDDKVFAACQEGEANF